LLDVLVLRNFSKVVAVSNDVAKRLRAGGVHEQRVIVIPNGVEVCTNNGNDDRKASHGFSAGGVVVGAVGRLVPEKGFQYLLQCAPEVLARFPEAKFLLVGDGPLRTDLENLARKLGISSRVIFTGEREDMRALYDRMDIFVLPSLNEGMPMSVLEAMAAMKPVIGTAVGGVPTVVIPEQTGLLVKPADPAALVDAISRLIGDSKLRGSLAEKAQRLVIERYSSREMASKYCSLYHEIARIRLIG
jgi:glycosyltransferase involved in cell wall biosynthesis